jgi:maleylacetate reductase
MTLGSFVHEQLPGRVVFGAGKMERLADEVDRLGTARALLISNAAAATIAERAGEVLGERVAERISKVAQHVPQEEADRAVRIALDADAGALIPVGGGSAVGLAKAVALTTAAPIVAVPTTYAGSEMTPIYGITSGGHKRTGRDPRVLPKTVVYDPELTTGLSSEVTATTAMKTARIQPPAYTTATARGIPTAATRTLVVVSEMAIERSAARDRARPPRDYGQG